MASLEEFGADQVEAYAYKWFNLDESVEPPSRVKFAESFLEESRYVEDLRTNPLMLSLMCGLYSGERYIPRNRPDIYEKCATLLFERWDKQRGINAPLPFDAGVSAAIRSLALWLYPQQSRTGIPKSELVRFMSQYLLRKRFDDEDEAEEAAESFIDFCRGRAWVLTDVGAELYWFTHQTFLEFFAASQLVRENASADGLLRVLEEHIRSAEWDVVAQLALQTLGKTVEDGADDFLAMLVSRGTGLSKSEQINVLSFAARSLAFIVPRPEVVKQIVQATICLATAEATTESKIPAVLLGERSAENMELVGKYVAAALPSRVQDFSSMDRVFALAFCFRSLRNRVAPGRLGRVPSGSVDVLGASETRLALEGSIEAGRSGLAWFAAREAWEGRIPVSRVVEEHGISAFYDCLMGGLILKPPPVWTIVQSGLGMPRESLPRVFIEELYEQLLSAPGPWLTGDPKRFEPLAGLGQLRLVVDGSPSGGSPPGRLQRGLALLLVLPIVEMLEDPRDLFGSQPPPRRRGGAGRDRRSALGSLLPEEFGGVGGNRQTLNLSLVRRHVDQPVVDVMKSWLNGKTTFANCSVG